METIDKEYHSYFNNIKIIDDTTILTAEKLDSLLDEDEQKEKVA